MGLTQQQRNDGYDAAVVPLDRTVAVTVKAAISTAAARIKLAAGTYKVSLRAADPSCDVYLAAAATDAATVAEPADTADAGDASVVAAGVSSFRGDEIERLRVDGGVQWVAFILSAGATATKIKFVRVL